MQMGGLAIPYIIKGLAALGPPSRKPDAGALLHPSFFLGFFLVPTRAPPVDRGAVHSQIADCTLPQQWLLHPLDITYASNPSTNHPLMFLRD